MADFLAALKRTLAFEGTGYTCNPRDPGGETFSGIDKAEAVLYRYTGPMSQMPSDLVERIYRNGYWNTLQLDMLSPANQHLANHLFDCGVNMGCGQSARFIEKTLDQTFKTNLDCDGIIGHRVKDAIRYFVNPSNIINVVSTFCILRKARYDAIIQKNPTLECFRIGWYKRCDPLT
jgi:lysozyme family protein